MKTYVEGPCPHCGAGTYAEHGRDCPTEVARRQRAKVRIVNLMNFWVYGAPIEDVLEAVKSLSN